MRRHLVGMVMLSGLALSACEDGPNQSFTPVDPKGAGNKWGVQGPDGYSENANKDFTAVGGTANPNELCTPIEKHAKWAKMVTTKIVPPSLAGINILGANADGTTSFAGLTIDQAEQVLCQSTPIGAEYTDNNPYNQWGDNGEVTLGYSATTRKAIQIEVHAGYKGTLDFTSRDGQHKFVISADNTQITKDGQPYTIHWKTTGDAQTPGTVKYEINEIYDAQAATFTSFLQEPDCTTSGHCSIADFDGDGAYFTFRTSGISFRVSSTIADLATGSKPERIIIRPVKIMGYSYGDILMKLDQSGEGPVAFDPNSLGTGKACTVKMGLDFKTFRDTCVTVWGATDTMADGKTLKNDIEMAKLFGGITHNDERFSFGVAGLNSAFTDKGLAADDIIRDQDRPSDDDEATSFVVTGGSLGRVANDYTNNDVTKPKDLHGLGLVSLEWMNLAQAYIQNLKYPDPKDAALKKVIGDPRCLVADPSTVDGCTGLEGVVTTAPTTSIPAGSPMVVNALGRPAATKFSSLVVGLKPGTWKSYFCNDANGIISGAGAGYTKCEGTGGFDSFFATPYNRLKEIYGKGVETNLPPEIRDLRFFFKQFVFAMIKYLQVADKPAATLADVHAGVIDPDNLFFDSIGSGQYEFAEYIDRHLVNSLGQDPTDLVISADTLHGLMSDYQFSRDLYRGEAAVYDVMLADRSNNKIGSENSALLMNMVGSPIVSGLYADVTGGWTGYQCATQNFGDHDADCDGQEVLTDADGNVLYDESVPPVPLLTKYPGAFKGKQTPFAIGQVTDIHVDSTHPFIRAATVTVPIHTDPFDPASALATPHVTLVPWIPKGNGAGFPIAVNGSQEKFINTHELDFSGNTISLNMNFLYPPDPVTHLDDFTKPAKVAAAETTDFLGEIFVCQEGADILRVRMYTSAQTILQWFADRPAAVADCDVIFQYGPFGNYLDYITMRATGIRLGINPGAGSGRVIDITVYDPAYN